MASFILSISIKLQSLVLINGSAVQLKSDGVCDRLSVFDGLGCVSPDGDTATQVCGVVVDPGLGVQRQVRGTAFIQHAGPFVVVDLLCDAAAHVGGVILNVALADGDLGFDVDTAAVIQRSITIESAVIDCCFGNLSVDDLGCIPVQTAAVGVGLVIQERTSAYAQCQAAIAGDLNGAAGSGAVDVGVSAVLDGGTG